MKRKNLIWLLLIGLAVWFFMTRWSEERTGELVKPMVSPAQAGI